ncbi:MAG: hypothetical protein FJZ47_15705 [Candidatus Tectomicrobia bacterium]|uniref:Bulb-type lectin domain-containing protein n=1 Tax=Tectimicrobiota bacterium TaxID=2528274 RepID=A0A937W1K8_UNCTE|nr:hypothetical protein [Candidatus Tectomicrobia bacterium]
MTSKTHGTHRWIEACFLAFLGCIVLLDAGPVIAFEIAPKWSVSAGTGSANAVTVGPGGDVYVTGHTVGATENYRTVRYTSTGTVVWSKTYNGPGSGTDIATAIAVDATGNVYVTGRSKGNGSELDYATIKYAPDGTQLWVARYNGPDSDDDEAVAIAIDATGNVYVTGESRPAGTGASAYATVKYDTNGNQLWAKRLSGGKASALAVDAAGNVYVTGTANGATTVKYNSSGTQL